MNDYVLSINDMRSKIFSTLGDKRPVLDQLFYQEPHLRNRILTIRPRQTKETLK